MYFIGGSRNGRGYGVSRRASWGMRQGTAAVHIRAGEVTMTSVSPLEINRHSEMNRIKRFSRVHAS